MLVLSLYLLSWGGAAFEVLTCRCVRSAEAKNMHLCCRDGGGHSDCAFHFAAIEAPCCCVDHSQGQTLYTSTDATDRSGKTLFPGAAAPVQGFAVAVPEPFCAGAPVGAPEIHPLSDGGGSRCGLRAPPVCA